MGEFYDEEAREKKEPNTLDLKKRRVEKNRIISMKLANSSFWKNLGLDMEKDGTLRAKTSY
ncbi:MAG: hypothetical protein KGI08_09730 [Thaumarchaeota archaeon]|nr:hypothetical protein [Nitrososphaerota archaeon]